MHQDMVVADANSTSSKFTRFFIYSLLIFFAVVYLLPLLVALMTVLTSVHEYW